MKNKTTYNANRLAKLIASEIAATKRAADLREKINWELESIPARGMSKEDAMLYSKIDSYYYNRLDKSREALAVALDVCIAARERERVSKIR